MRVLGGVDKSAVHMYICTSLDLLPRLSCRQGAKEERRGGGSSSLIIRSSILCTVPSLCGLQPFLIHASNACLLDVCIVLLHGRPKPFLPFIITALAIHRINTYNPQRYACKRYRWTGRWGESHKDARSRSTASDRIGCQACFVAAVTVAYCA